MLQSLADPKWRRIELSGDPKLVAAAYHYANQLGMLDEIIITTPAYTPSSDYKTDGVLTAVMQQHLANEFSMIDKFKTNTLAEPQNQLEIMTRMSHIGIKA